MQQSPCGVFLHVTGRALRFLRGSRGNVREGALGRQRWGSTGRAAQGKAQWGERGLSPPHRPPMGGVGVLCSPEQGEGPLRPPRRRALARRSRTFGGAGGRGREGLQKLEKPTVRLHGMCSCVLLLIFYGNACAAILTLTAFTIWVLEFTTVFFVFTVCFLMCRGGVEPVLIKLIAAFILSSKCGI